MIRHWASLWLLVAGVVIAVALIVEQVLHVPVVEYTRRLLTEPGLPAAAVIVGLLGVDLFLPVPSSLVMILSGVVFGVVPGAALSTFGSLAGNLLGFELSRRYGPGLARRLVGEGQLGKMSAAFERHGGLAILLSRPIPVLMETVSVVAGLAAMKRSRFLAASIASTVPMCLVYAWAGSTSLATRDLIPALAAAVLVPAAGWLIWQRLHSRPRS